MCGRYGLVSSKGEIREALPAEAFFTMEDDLDLTPRYNISPTQLAPVLRHGPEGFHLEGSRWGLVPTWMWKRHEREDNTPAPAEAGFINARAESAAEKASFREAFAQRRCAVPVSGFYEWQKASAKGEGKQPHYIQMSANVPEGYKKAGLFFLAGIYEPWGEPHEHGVSGGVPTHSFAILTTQPNAAMQGIHDRMPIVLSPSHLLNWLDWPASRGTAEDGEILESCPSDWLEIYAGSLQVNSPDNDDPSLIQPLQEPLALS